MNQRDATECESCQRLEIENDQLRDAVTIWQKLADERKEQVAAQSERLVALTETGAIPAGWKLVPLVPTEEMEKAAAHEDSAYSNNRFTFPSESRFFNVYAAMLRTAPEAKE